VGSITIRPSRSPDALDDGGDLLTVRLDDVDSMLVPVLLVGWGQRGPTAPTPVQEPLAGGDRNTHVDGLAVGDDAVEHLEHDARQVPRSRQHGHLIGHDGPQA
jgi:hypothetical protein